jgi:hypothetical protein
MSELVRYDAMCRAIDAAYEVDEVKAIHDQARMLEAAARCAFRAVIQEGNGGHSRGTILSRIWPWPMPALNLRGHGGGERSGDMINLAIIELRHVIAALDRIRINLSGTAAEKDVERLLEAAKDTLVLVKSNKGK